VLQKFLKIQQNISQTITGTYAYMFPEMMSRKRYDFETDLCYLGILLYEVCSLYHRFYSDALYGLMNNIMKSEMIP
jgi:serine/threonine protein kinase